MFGTYNDDEMKLGEFNFNLLSDMTYAPIDETPNFFHIRINKIAGGKINIDKSWASNNEILHCTLQYNPQPGCSIENVHVYQDYVKVHYRENNQLVARTIKLPSTTTQNELQQFVNHGGQIKVENSEKMTQY